MGSKCFSYTLALTACRNGGIIVPAFPDKFSEDGIRELWETISVVKEYTNKNLRVLGILLTNHNPQTNLSQIYLENYQNLAQMMEAKLFKTHIRRNIKLAEAASTGSSIDTCEKQAPRLLEDYNSLIEKLLETIRKGETHVQG